MATKKKTEAEKALSEPVGRPTKYLPKYCDMLIDHMESGLEYLSFAGLCRVHYDTLYQWEKDYPEFSEAKKIGKALSFLYWDKLGRDGVKDREHFDDEGKLLFKEKVNPAVYIFNMKNRHGWRDTAEATGNDAKLNISLNYNLKEGALNGSEQ